MAAQQRTYNTLRRLLPTAANVFQLSQSVCQAVGSWEEVPQGEGGSVGHATRPMSVHYSAELALASGKAKADAFEKFQHLIILVACETLNMFSSAWTGARRTISGGRLPMVSHLGGARGVSAQVPRLNICGIQQRGRSTYPCGRGNSATSDA